MPFFASISRSVRVSVFFSISLIFSVVAIAQDNLVHRLLNGYFLSPDVPVNKGKTTLFVIDQADTFKELFYPAATNKKPDAVNFTKDMVIGIALPPTNKPPKLSISRVFVQDSVLTVRYIRMKDTTLTNSPQSFMSQPMLLVAIPKQSVLKTKLVENGRVIQTLKTKSEEGK